MKLATYRINNAAPRLGVIQDNHVIDLEDVSKINDEDLPKTMLELIDMGIPEVARIQKIIDKLTDEQRSNCIYPLSNITLLAPIPRPRKNIIGIGLNYTEHVAESARSLDTSNELPIKPIIFTKPPTTVIGTGEYIIHNPKLTQQLDWEVELAVIIGKKARYIKKQDAMDYVFGYTIINDISARDCRRAGQWIVSKGQDTFAPMGPYIVTKDEISNPNNLNLSLKLNGIEKQKSNTKFMLFDISELIEDLSIVFTLEPGDIIASGTPAGVGAGRNPQEWMWNGDVVEATVEGIGTIVNTVKEL